MAGIILTGGRSARMGKDKALLPWGRATLLEHVAGLVESVTSPILIVADSRARFDGFGWRVAEDIYPGEGPLGGIITGLEAAGPGFHVVVACDLPLLQPSLLQFVIDVIPRDEESALDVTNGESSDGDGREQTDAIVPTVNGRREPLCAVYNGNAIPKLRRAIEVGERSVHRVLAKLNCLWIEEVRLREYDPMLLSFTNVNTPEEYERLRRIHGGA